MKTNKCPSTKEGRMMAPDFRKTLTPMFAISYVPLRTILPTRY
ncbi:hypothetical protein M6B38_333105 [Iris pallida]|uniref:Uncharacterized protein n=1 Tax=Iris pallida TaxID=29817 RepID=A0AAX6H2G0_IRIPA|nr:hypothetical protein M6B38_414290 [Iris pallida]KAJ6834818.1 hypothetical protein M6B38_333100 [Iris pallida]KAJ6834819.1 hypothetical protein M6B38_333105 [Iris pallida]